MTTPITRSDQLETRVLVDIKTESLVLIGASGIAGVEAVAVEIEDGFGGSPGVIQDEINLELSVDNNVTHLRGPGQYYLIKPETAADSHLFMYAPAQSEVGFTEV